MELNQNAPAPRVPLVLEIEYRKSYGRSSEVGQLRNISLTGAFLEHANNELRPNDKLCLVIKVSGRTRKVAASIIWANKAGCGIKFRPSNNRDAQIVDDLIYFVESKRESRRSVLDSIIKQVG